MDGSRVHFGAAWTNFFLVTLNECMAFDAFKCALKPELLPQFISLVREFFVSLLEVEDLFNPLANLLIEVSVLCLVHEFKNVNAFANQGHLNLLAAVLVMILIARGLTHCKTAVPGRDWAMRACHSAGLVVWRLVPLLSTGHCGAGPSHLLAADIRP
jgi:hypothetical protein